MTPLIPGAPVRGLVELALRAPSLHNTQPWHWCVAGERLVLFADTSRQLEYADPDRRDLVISCGAALHHLQVASAAAGWKARARRMPNRYNDNQLANISFDRQEPTPQALAALDALRRRRTDRRRPTSWPVPHDRLDGLIALGPHAGVTVFAVVSHRMRAELLQLLAEAEEAQRLNPRYVEEIIRWTGREDDEGIPATSLLRRDAATGPQTTPSRFPSGILADHDPEAEPVEPALLAICTSSDDTASRLRAGEALSAILLKGTADGLLMVPLSQATEVDRTRLLLQNELLDDTACPQILVQVGCHPPRPSRSRSPHDARSTTCSATSTHCPTGWALTTHRPVGSTRRMVCHEHRYPRDNRQVSSRVVELCERIRRPVGAYRVDPDCSARNRTTRARPWARDGRITCLIKPVQ